MRKDVVRLGLRMLLFSLIAAALLAGTYLITKGPIEQQELAAAQSAQRAVLPEAGRFELMDLASIAPDAASQYANVKEVYEGKAGDEVVGYVLTAAPQGYGGPMPITLSVGTDGSIHGIAVGELKETANIGSKVGEEPFLKQFDALAADPAVIESEVDTIGGATVSSGPFKQSVREMTALTMTALGIEPHPGTPKAPELTGDDLLRKALLPDSTEFSVLSPYALVGEFDAIEQIHRAVQGRDAAGYVFELASKGFVDQVAVRAAIDAQGTITGVALVSQNETPEYGGRIESAEGEAFLKQFAGKPAEGFGEDIDVIGGATITSNAVVKSVKQAAAFYTQYLIPKPDPDAGITFEDIALPTPDDYKAVQSAQRGMRDGAAVKYRFIVRVTGYNEAAPMLLQVDLDGQGNYESLLPIEQSETPGIGADVFGNADFISQIVGKPGAVETADTVVAVSGATVTSDAIKRGIKQAARAYLSIADGAATPAAEGAPAVAQFPTVPAAFEGATFEPVAFTDENKQFATVKAIDKAIKDGALIGYRLVTVSTGYNETEKITLQFEIDAAGNFVDVTVLSQAETKGFGADLLLDAAYIGKPVGQTADPESTGLIDAKSGATLTADAVKKAAKHAAAAYLAVKEVP